MREDAHEEVVAIDGPEIARRVMALLPEIEGRGDEIAAARRLPRDLVDALKATGVFRMSMPEAWGGPALPLPEQVRIVESLAYTDPSVGWCVMIGSDSGFYSAFLDDAAARGLWTDLDDITAGWLFPGGQAIAADGGYRVSGRWKFGSGCTHADVMVAGCIVMNDIGAPVIGPDGMPVVRTVVARADRFDVIDTWHTTGLAGSGSNDYACRDLFVPVAHTFSLAEPARRDGPLHALPGGFLTNMHGVALGLARRAIDEATAVVTAKVMLPEGVPMRELPRVRDAVADAQRRHRSAAAYAERSIDNAWAQVASGDALSVDQRVDLILSRVEAFRMAQDVTTAMVRLVGTQAIYATSILDRLVRDAITINQHIAAGPVMVDAAGRLSLGVELQGFVAAIV
jgi:indole-3-acetate monooxygenase